MASTSLADSPQSTTTEPVPEYVLRGHGLFEIHAEEILASYQGAGVYLIPSGSESGKAYEVRLGTRRKAARCECTGFFHHRHCSHIEAARIAARKSAVCDSCGKRRGTSTLRKFSRRTGSFAGISEI
jgi:hypothetical protein